MKPCHQRAPKACRKCGQSFVPSWNTVQYCEGCRNEQCVCQHCGITFPRQKSTKGLFCSTACKKQSQAWPVGATKSDSKGYTLVKVPEGTPGIFGRTQPWMFEHRFVMQEYLGRPLSEDEHVHHINGNKTDNHIENLELWVRVQPSGTRVSDYHCPGCRCFD